MRRLRDDDSIGPSKGWLRFLHKAAMIILWPLRKPFWFIGILAVLFLAPTFRGVKPAEVHSWYWSKIKSSSFAVSDKTKGILPDFSAMELPAFKTSSKDNSPAAKVVDMPVKEVRRKTFERAKSAPVKIDIMEQKRETAAPVAVVNTPAVQMPKTLTTTPAETTRKKLALVYVTEAKNINGVARVVNANEIIIGTDHIFLYGIYVNPDSDKGRRAKSFLTDLIENQTVNCIIEAYTYQGVATGICSAGEINLNKAMVEGGHSKNVALD